KEKIKLVLTSPKLGATDAMTWDTLQENAKLELLDREGTTSNLNHPETTMEDLLKHWCLKKVWDLIGVIKLMKLCRTRP
ncbi:hypothetical protein, partial [Escherichia coli]|uniref:hypothetical protein n=1 Tax=Escherichia coli TaxID=562 RepID=UPI002022E140